MTTGSTCAWSTTSNAAWLTVGSGSTGNGSVNVTVAANTGTAQRTGSVTIAGQTFSVTQAGTPCTFTIAPTSRTSPAAGESVAVAVTTGSTCAWSTTSNAAWLTVGSGQHRQRQRQRHRRREYRDRAAHRIGDDCRPDLQRHAGRHAVHVHDRADQPYLARRG